MSKINFTREEVLEIIEEFKPVSQLDNWNIRLKLRSPENDNFLAESEQSEDGVWGGCIQAGPIQRNAAITINTEIEPYELRHQVVHEMLHILFTEEFKTLCSLIGSMEEPERRIYEDAEERLVCIFAHILAPIKKPEGTKCSNGIIYASDCCEAPLETTDPTVDFLMDNPEDIEVGTANYVCIKCGEVCDAIPVSKIEEWEQFLVTTPKDQVSSCCSVEMKLSEMLPDFIGDDPKTQKVGTAHYICTECKKQCNPVLKEELRTKLNESDT